jgi:hypothetical protein
MTHKGILYNWNVTDQWGWDLTQQNFRNHKLNTILNENSNTDEYLYHIELHNTDNSSKMATATFYPNDKIFKIISFDPYDTNTNGISVKFDAENINQCEKILQYILKPNKLEVFTKYKI